MAIPTIERSEWLLTCRPGCSGNPKAIALGRGRHKLAHLVIWGCAGQSVQLIVSIVFIAVKFFSQFASRFLQRQLIFYANLALGDVFNNCVCELVANLHRQVMAQVQQTDLTDILCFCHLLAYDRGFIASIAARAPSKLGVWPFADMALCSVLYLHITNVYSNSCNWSAVSDDAGLSNAVGSSRLAASATNGDM